MWGKEISSEMAVDIDSCAIKRAVFFAFFFRVFMSIYALESRAGSNPTYSLSQMLQNDRRVWVQQNLQTHDTWESCQNWEKHNVLWNLYELGFSTMNLGLFFHNMAFL